MISKQKQIGQLRSALLRAMRDYRFRQSLIYYAKGNYNVATGKFLKVLQKAKDDVFNINAYFSPEGLIEEVALTVDLPRLLGNQYGYYFQTLDYQASLSRTWQLNPGGEVISRWIGDKINNRTWKGSTSVPYTKQGSKGRASKTIMLDLNEVKDRKRLAYAIAKAIKNNNDISSKGDYTEVIIDALTDIAEAAFTDFLNNVGINIYNEVEIVLNDIF